MQEVYLLLGSNRGDRECNLLQACTRIRQKVGDIIRISSLYETEPWGFKDEISFYNQALMVSTSLSPDGLMLELQKIESELGRLRESPGSSGDSCACHTAIYSSRTMDIDILFYDRKILFTEKLMIPHPRMHNRRFALIPMDEIAPGMIHPVYRKSITDLLHSCTDTCWVNKIVRSL
jgi:2-amino-4-hydroxy-6-hydroxymethyldihydropteridine diphosphokinase